MSKRNNISRAEAIRAAQHMTAHREELEDLTLDDLHKELVEKTGIDMARTTARNLRMDLGWKDLRRFRPGGLHGIAAVHSRCQDLEDRVARLEMLLAAKNVG